MNQESNSEKRYLIIFIDDFNRKSWVYFILEKSEALDMFKRFESLFEKEAGFFAGCLRTVEVVNSLLKSSISIVV